MDQCTHCIVMGKHNLCATTPCTQHESWMVNKLKKGLLSVLSLIEQSHGVSGLHLNGDDASWESLRSGGYFEEWLMDFDAAIELIKREGK